VLRERVQLERALDVAQVDEAVDLAVRVAGDVGQDRAARGLLWCRCSGMIGKSWWMAQESGTGLEEGEVEEVRVAMSALEVARSSGT
jgi:hypothetical protein